MQDTDPFDYQGIEAAVAKRLRPVCPNLSADEFDDLVRTAAAIQWKYEQQRDREARILFGMLEVPSSYLEDR
jgi:hypothetical protein